MTKFKYIFPLVLLLFSFSIPNSCEDRVNNPDKIYLNYESSLPYGYYVAVHRTANENFEVKWEFAGSNENIGIIVYALTELEYTKFHNSQPFDPYHLSDGSNYQDSGTFIPPSSDHWYFVFLNADPDTQTTSLTYDVEFIQSPALIIMIVGIIIAFIAVGGIIAAIIIVHNKKGMKKLRNQEASQSVTPSSNQDQKELINNQIQDKFKFCIHCGKTRRNENAFCENCGKKF